MDYNKLVPKPNPADINSGLHAMSMAEALKHFGAPRKTYSANCQPITNRALASRMVTKDVGPFRVTCLDVVANDLIAIFADIKAENPELYKALGSAGMLCCRLVRGSKTTLSNHSYGLPIDLKINGVLDVRGDDKVQAGLLALYPFFHKHKWYWGADRGSSRSNRPGSSPVRR